MLNNTWYLYPIVFSTSNDYLPKIFELLIYKSILINNNIEENLISLSNRTVADQEILKQKLSMKNQEASFVKNLSSIIRSII